MRSLLVAVVVAGLVAGTAWAVEIPLRGGGAIEATSYELTGSYAILHLPDGSKVAYDIKDIDVVALQKAQAEAAATEAEPVSQAPSGGDTIMSAVSLPKEGSEVRITDGDVAHLRPQPQDEAGDEAEGAEDEAPPAPGAGTVLVRGVGLVLADETNWELTGQVVNQTAGEVQDVQVELVYQVDGQQVAAVRLAVAATLAAGQSRTFSHRVQTGKRPQAVVRAFWLQPTPAS